jgi:hypothetical protein
LISGGDLREGQVFYVWSKEIRRGDLYEGQISSKHNKNIKFIQTFMKNVTNVHLQQKKKSRRRLQRREAKFKKNHLEQAVKTLRGSGDIVLLFL